MLLQLPTRRLAPVAPAAGAQQGTGKSLWPGVLGFHLWGEPELWADGQHTERSRARLDAVWAVLELLLERAT